MKDTCCSYFQSPFRTGPHFSLKLYKEKEPKVLEKGISRLYLRLLKESRLKEAIYRAFFGFYLQLIDELAFKKVQYTYEKLPDPVISNNGLYWTCPVGSIFY